MCRIYLKLSVLCAFPIDFRSPSSSSITWSFLLFSICRMESVLRVIPIIHSDFSMLAKFDRSSITSFRSSLICLCGMVNSPLSVSQTRSILQRFLRSIAQNIQQNVVSDLRIHSIFWNSSFRSFQRSGFRSFQRSGFSCFFCWTI